MNIMGEYFNEDDIRLYFDKERKKREIEFNRYLGDMISRGKSDIVLNTIPRNTIINYLLSHNINNLLESIPEELLNNFVRDKKLKKISK